jgi:transketolase
VLPSGIPARLAVEAGSPLGWHRWVGSEGAVLGIDRFGESAPAADVFRELGFTPENVASRARALVS